MGQILLINAEVITVTNKVLKNCAIGINNGTIDFFESNLNLDLLSNLIPKYDKILNCTNKIVMPGFVNAHSHSVMIVLRNLVQEGNLQEWIKETKQYQVRIDTELAFWAAKLATLEMIKNGITTFADLYSFKSIIKQVAIEVGIRCVLMHNDDHILVSHSLGIDNIYNNSERLKEFSQKGVPLQIHLAETKSEYEYCLKNYSMTPVKYLKYLGVLNSNLIASHCIYVNDEDIELLAENHVNVVCNLKSNLKLMSGVLPIEKMINAGINVCLGTDGAASNNNLDMIEEMKFNYYIHRGINRSQISHSEIIKMATLNGAKAFKLNCGEISIGKNADLIILNTQKPRYFPKNNIEKALVVSGNSEDIETVIINGKIVKENGIIVTLNESKILDTIQNLFEKSFL